jgi:hypothetical protein
VSFAGEGEMGRTVRVRIEGASTFGLGGTVSEG